MSITFYRLFLWLYKCGVILLSPYNKKANRWLSGRKRSFHDLQRFTGIHQGKNIWFHCASLGEFEQARPLLEGIRNQYPGYRILLSFFSPSGYEIRKDYTGADQVIYLPADGSGNAKQMLDMVRPSLVIWVKYEYWYFYLQQIKQRNIPLLLVSGIFRAGQPFFRSWGHLHRSMLGCFTHLFVQDQHSKKLLGSIGFSDTVAVSGDTRFDRVIEIASQTESIPMVEGFINDCPAIVAGSTWEEDEQELDHFANSHPEIKFIIAPHEIDEQRLKDIEKLFHHPVRYSSLVSAPDEIRNSSPNISDQIPNVLIIDNIGLLAQLYKYATVAYVGGGFGDDGVHNTLEAAVYGKPVVFGPVYEKFAEAVQLIDAGGAFCVENALELEEQLLILLKNESEYKMACKAAGDYVYANKGATQKILTYIQEKRLLTN